jgi:hypothetical protein
MTTAPQPEHLGLQLGHSPVYLVRVLQRCAIVAKHYHITRKQLLERSSKESNCEFHHVLLNSSTEKCFYRRAKVEGQHPRTHRPHTSCIGASGGIFLLLLLARIGIEAISEPGKQLIVEIHARGVILLFRSPNHRELTL